MVDIFLPRFLDREQASPSNGLVAAEDLWEIVPESAGPLAEALAALPGSEEHYHAAYLLPLVTLTNPQQGRALANRLLELDQGDPDYDEYESFVKLRLRVGEEALLNGFTGRLVSDR